MYIDNNFDVILICRENFLTKYSSQITGGMQGWNDGIQWSAWIGISLQDSKLLQPIPRKK